MKKIIYILTILLISFCFNPKVKASSTCSYKEQNELSKAANNVKFVYAPADDPDKYFTINVNNITDSIYVTVKNNFENKTLTYNSSDNATFILENVTYKRTFYIRVYSKNPNCQDELLRKWTVSTPKYNQYYTNPFCEGLHDYPICAKYYDGDLTLGAFYEKIELIKKEISRANTPANEEEQELTFMQKLSDFVSNNYIILSAIVIAATATIIVVEVKRKKRII